MPRALQWAMLGECDIECKRYHAYNKDGILNDITHEAEY